MAGTKRRLPRVLLALLASLLLGDLLLNLVVIRDGLFLDVPLPPFEGVTHPNQERWIEDLARAESPGNGRFDAELGWSWKPSSVDPEGVHIGALGARGAREYAREKPVGTTRVLCFGDSFTFCDDVGDEAAFERILEKRQRDFEVLNFGVSGYGTDQALLRFRRLGTELDADVVCIGILLENIGRNVNRFRPLWSTRTGFCATKPRFVLAGEGNTGLELVPQPFPTKAALRAALLDGTVLDHVAEHEYWLGRPTVPTGRASALVRLGAAFLAERERTPARLWRDPAGEPFRTTVALLAAFRAEALASGARLAPILVFPTREDLALRLEADDGPVYWDAFLDELARRGCHAIDLSVPLAERERGLRADPSQGTLYFKSHLSSVGNSVVADTLGDWILERPNLQEEGMSPETALEELDTILAGSDPWQEALAWVIEHSGTSSGTIHLMGSDELLHLAASVEIPPQILEIVQTIPIGKGMAGLAAERREPISLCNLQTDDSGDARPRAKETGLRGTVAVPMLVMDRVLGTLGVGQVGEREFDAAETRLLLGAAERIGRRHMEDE